jgi:hypothetical protein
MRIPLLCQAHSPEHEVMRGYGFVPAEHRYSQPLNAWIENNEARRVLLNVYHKGGVEILRTQYGFDCAPAEAAPPCGNCYVCRATMVGRVPDDEMAQGWDGQCQRLGTVSIELRIGPGPNDLRVLTYWQRPPV